MQTSIEWLIEEMFKQGYFDGNKPLSITNLDHLQQQAKEIHKQEIIDAVLYGIEDCVDTGDLGNEHLSQKYYQDTFKKD